MSALFPAAMSRQAKSQTTERLTAHHVLLLSRCGALAMALLATGCDFGIVYVDPPVDFAPVGLVIEGPPTVELGFYEEQLYNPLLPGGHAPVVHGLQGGSWTHPAVRTTGIGTPAVIDCNIIAGTGEQVADVRSNENFVVAIDGFLEVQSHAVRILHTDPDSGPEIDDLYDQPATLSCSVLDAQERGSSKTVEVILVEG